MREHFAFPLAQSEALAGAVDWGSRCDPFDEHRVTGSAIAVEARDAEQLARWGETKHHLIVRLFASSFITVSRVSKLKAHSVRPRIKTSPLEFMM